MYLSRLILNRRSRGVQRDLARPHELHRTILRAFPDNLDETNERVLFRLDQTNAGALHLLVQSRSYPDWDYLTSSDYLDQTNEPNPSVKAVDLTVKAGQALAFRLRANPTKRLSAGTGNKGKRIGLYKLDEQEAWIRRKAANHGFALHSVSYTRQEQLQGRVPRKEPNKTEDRQYHDAKFFSVQYDGVLQVTDPEKFLDAIAVGIGSGKAFGFGLLSVAPIR